MVIENGVERETAPLRLRRPSRLFIRLADSRARAAMVALRARASLFVDADS
jgi:hypothetical protein